MRKPFYSAALCWVLFVTLLVLSCRKQQSGQPPVSPVSVHLTLGNPSEAVADSTIFSNYLMVKPQYALSYNRERGTPNWVSWRLDPSSLGSAPRQDNFRPDLTLPGGWYRVQTSDYTGSGFDRGHNCPSADRTRTEEDNAATFLMTNMIPQAPNNNQTTWANLESYCRKLVDDGNELYIIMGVAGTGGTGSNGVRTTLAAGKITVPNRIWKVIVVLPQGTDDLQRVTEATRVIAVNTPNTHTIDADWSRYRTSVDALETATGYDLLSALPARLQASLEARVDNGPAH
ncbi:DNA/RNA non-specific endonuclease [Paraflavisolibacter sp. H34]|uniref:DNA/RNA non-specific endonuclease n=1 Tax=Huijunlia imazamoxiresistens TaxID=3127457 RepID=UPI003019913F